MKSIKLLSAILCLLFAVEFQGQTTKGAYAFLDMTSSARVAALGNTDLSIYDSDIELGIYNPALINKDMHNNLVLSYVNYYADIHHAMAQYGRTFKKLGSFTGTVLYHGYGGFKYADESGHVDGGSFFPSDFNVMIGWGRQLTPHWSIGANLKFVGIQYEHFKTFAIAVDVAGSYRTDAGWMFSLTARNIGYELYSNFEGDRNKLPFRMSAGVAKRLEHVPFLFSIVYENIQKWDMSYDDPLDLEGTYDPVTGKKREQTAVGKFADNLMSHLVVGGEIYIGKNLVLRLAYNYGMRKNLKTPTRKGLCGFSYGVGIKTEIISFSYSRSEMHIYGSPNYFTVAINLANLLKNTK